MRAEHKKRVFAAALSVMVLFGAVLLPAVVPQYTGSAVYADEYFNLRVRNTGDSNTRQDSECSLEFKITNTKDTAFSFDSAVLEFEKNEGLTISGSLNANVSFSKKDDTADVLFTVTTRRFCDTGTRNYRLILKKGGETVYTSQYFYLVISENLAEPGKDGNYIDSVDIRYSITPEGGFKTGRGNSISLEVYNNGNSSLKNAQLKLELPDGISIDNGSNTQGLGTILIGKRAFADFPLVIESSAENKSYVIKATVSGINAKNETTSIEKDFYIPVHGSGKKDDPSDVGTPQLMVSDYSYGGSFVQAGTQFPLQLSLINTSKSTLYNVKVTISSSDGSFVPVHSSNAFYIDQIGGGKTYSKTLTLSAKNDAEQQTTAITVGMSYEDSEQKSFTSEDTISVPVTQKTRLVIDELVPPTECYVGNPGSASVNFYNMGKTTLANVRVNASGNFDIMESNSYYAGNMESGRNDSYSFTFIPRELGPMEGSITFSYEDAAGDAQYTEIPFTFEVTEMPVSDDPGMYDEPQVEKAIPWGLIIGAIVLVVGIIFAVVLRKILKKRKEKALELEDMSFEVPTEEDSNIGVDAESGASTESDAAASDADAVESDKAAPAQEEEKE